MIEYATIDHSRESWRLDESLWTRVRNVIAFLMLLGWAGCAAGYVQDSERFFRSYLVGFLDMTLIALGCLFFVMVMYLTGSAWSVTVRRIFETIMVTIPLAAVLVLPILGGIHHLYEWSHSDHVAHDKILLGKSAWLNPEAFVIRAFVYVLIWSVMAIRIYTNSTAQDKTKSIKHMDSTSTWSAPGLLLVFLSVSTAAFDWIMSLNPHWYSTIFGIYVYAGGGLACIATVTVICLWLRRHGILAQSIHLEHYHDLGKWMFALTVFWAYIAFSQYMLIWYANLAEETVFYTKRLVGSWKFVSGLLLFGHFIIPFFFLIQRRVKRNMGALLAAALWILTICYVDLYWLVMPNFDKEGVRLHWLDAVAWLAVASTYAFAFWWQLKKHSLVPEGDARLEQSLAHVNV
jgi:hypothetical protein